MSSGPSGNNGRPASRQIDVEYLARVEGEGALHLRIEDDRVAAVQLRIFEPPRFFEALLVGRDFREAPDITARICGICPVAYLMSSVHAMEALCGVEVEPAVRDLRRLLYCGEWIESHGLHMHMLHLPDFLGYPDAVHAARDHPEVVRRGLRLKKAGNSLVELIGGREIHPINIRVGGFYKAPSIVELQAIRPQLEAALDDALEAGRFVAGLDFPEFERDYLFVALQNSNEYPTSLGQLGFSDGRVLPVGSFNQELVESHETHSHALQTRTVEGRAVHMGPLARYALNREQLSPRAQELVQQTGLEPVCLNPYKSILVRAVEVVHACETALQLIDGYTPPAQPAVEVEPRAGIGAAATEAPRGMLFHQYQIDANGLIESAQIVPPTSVNQATIEEDLYHYVSPRVGESDDQLRSACELAIRNYDPCISCATHFLDLTVERG